MPARMFGITCRGVHVEDGGKRLVATDGHRLALVDDAPTGSLPEKERSTDTVLGKDGKWIEGKFPDYKRVLPEKHETTPVEVRPSVG